MKYVFLIIPLYIFWGIKKKKTDVAFFVLCTVAFIMGAVLYFCDGVYLTEMIFGGKT